MANSISETNNIAKIVRNVLAILLVACFFIIAYSKLHKFVVKNDDGYSILKMSKKKITRMLTSDTKRINILVEAVQKIPQEIALILEFQKIDMEEIKIVQNSILLNSPELFGTAVAFEPYMFKKDTLYFSSYLYRKKDKILHATLDGPEYDYFYQDWYIIPKILQKPSWSNPYYDDGGGGVFMTSYSVPFYSFDGTKETFKGIVTVDVSIEWLASYFSNKKVLPNNGYVILVSEDGTIICAPDTKWIMNETIFTLSLSLNIPELREVGRELQKGHSGIRKMTSPLSNEKISVFYSVIHSNNWGLLYLIPEKASTQK